MDVNTISIILVDDHKMVRDTWKLLLHGQENINIIGECASGAEALEIVPKLQPHVVLMDINMSPVNGFEATRKIIKRCPQVKIIGVSVNNQPGYAKNIMQLGAKGYVTKNSDCQEMILAIKEVMQGKTFVCAEVKEKMEAHK